MCQIENLSSDLLLLPIESDTLGKDTRESGVEAVMDGSFFATYLWPFKLQGAYCHHKQFEKHGWDPKIPPFDAISEYNIRAYFPKPIIDLFLNSAIFYKRNDFKSITITDLPGIVAEFQNITLIIFPNDICFMTCAFQYLRADSAQHDITLEQFLNVNAVVRQLYPPFLNKSGEPGVLKEIVFTRTDGSEIVAKYGKSPDTKNILPPINLSLWTILLYKDRESKDAKSFHTNISHFTDNRLPAILFCLLNKSDLTNSAFIYKSIVGDSTSDVLPRKMFYTAFLNDSAIDDYFDECDDDLNVRYFVYSHCFGMFGSRNDSFFREVIFLTYKTNYFLMFVLKWYQYIYIQSELSELHSYVDSGRDGQSWRKLSGIIDRRTRNLTTTLLSDGAIQNQAKPFKKKLNDSLDIEKLAASMKKEFDDLYNYMNSKETKSVTSAAVAIGLLSIISIIIALFFGLIGSDSHNIPINIEKLSSSLGQGLLLSECLFFVGFFMVLIISVASFSWTQFRDWLCRTFIHLAIYVFTAGSILISIWLLVRPTPGQ